MNVLLWIAQIILAIIFLVSGISKSIFSEKELIAKGQTGVVGLPAAEIKFIGTCELLGVLGVILPWALGIWPVLTPIAAFGFAVMMSLAAPIHIRLKEPKNVAINITILIIALFVAWGRWRGL